MSFATKAWLSLVVLAVVTAAVLFVPAGTIDACGRRATDHRATVLSDLMFYRGA
jgi:hypothetical protein